MNKLVRYIDLNEAELKNRYNLINKYIFLFLLDLYFMNQDIKLLLLFF